MIRFILLQNRQGRTRLARWYTSYLDDEKAKLARDVHSVISRRERRWSHFIDYRDFKLIFRQYAGLYFILGVDLHDNEFAIYEVIQLFVELLDAYFGNVCELDLVFNFDKVYQLLDYLILAGELADTSQAHLLARIKYTDAAAAGKRAVEVE